jgi:hypothetical protein
MKQTQVSYGQLDQVLRGLGFSCQVLHEEPATRLYEHKDSGAWIMLPLRDEKEAVPDYHLANVRTTLDGFGIANPKALEGKLQKAG